MCAGAGKRGGSGLGFECGALVHISTQNQQSMADMSI
jgi:hypothetical protein